MNPFKSVSIPSWNTISYRSLLLLGCELLVGLTFLGAVLFLRAPSFGRSVVDWDESVYLLMAREWLRGSLPYTTLWDHKPPALYLLFVSGQWVFGQTIVSIRILTCLAVALSCYLIYRFGRDILYSTKTGILAAILYMAFSLKNVGETAHAELLFNPFVLLGFYLILRLFPKTQVSRWRLILIGLVFGVAMQIKFSVLFDFIAAVMVYILVVVAWRKWFSFSTVWVHAMEMGVGFLMPLLVFVSLYAAAGQLEVFIHANFTANIIYGQLIPFSVQSLVNALLVQVKTHILLWTALWLTPAFLLQSARPPKRLDYRVVALLIWVLGSFMGVNIAKRFYPYYFLQMLSPLCLLAAHLVINAAHALKEKPLWTRSLLVGLILLALFEPLFIPMRTSLTAIRQQWYKQPDKPALVAAYLNERIDHDARLFVVDYQPVLYYLVDGVIPTRYIVPMVLTHDDWARVAGIDRYRELAAIMACPPDYVVLKDRVIDDKFYTQLYAYLSQDYKKEISLHGVRIYRRSTSRLGYAADLSAPLSFCTRSPSHPLPPQPLHGKES